MNCHLAAFDVDKSGSDMKRLQTEFKFEFPGWLSQQPVTNPEESLGPKNICILCPVCFISNVLICTLNRSITRFQNSCASILHMLNRCTFARHKPRHFACVINLILCVIYFASWDWPRELCTALFCIMSLALA